MYSMNNQHIPTYASVDLELTGFDPETEEILEVGIILFQVVDGALVRTDRYATLVRPQKSHMRHRIAGLTGIAAADLDRAPVWEEVGERVRELLAGTVLVGHGVELDLRFLQAAGVAEFAGVIDTLELAQVFLPTYHSYNLESLGHVFSVSHEGVHRAGGDAEATVGVLEGCAGIYRQLPQSLQMELCAIARASGQTWPQLFSSLECAPSVPDLTKFEVPAVVRLEEGVPQRSSVVKAGWGKQVPDGGSFAGAIPAWVVAFFDREQVFQYARMFPEVEPYVGAFEYLSQSQLDEARDNFLDLSQKERIALQKVLVWKALYSTFGLLSEINWSIVGTEAKRNFTAGFAARFPQGLTAVDFRSLADGVERRPLWVHSLEDLFEWCGQKSGYVISWQSLIASLRHTLAAEAATGSSEKEAEASRAIAAVDTYFVSVLLLLRRTIYRAAGATDPAEIGSYAWSKIEAGGLGLAQKLESSQIYQDNTFFQKQVSSLKRFFADSFDKNVVTWVEFSDKNVSFCTKPIELSATHRQFTTRASLVVYQTALLDELALKYIRSRIGLSESVPLLHARPTVVQATVMLDESADPFKVLNQIVLEGGSTLILFEDVESLRQYYDVTYPSVAGKVSVLAVGVHGGAHKILRNFNRSQRTIVLAALQALQGYTGESAQFQNVCYVPSQQGAASVHPYIAAIANNTGHSVAELEQLHEKIALVRALAAISLAHITCFRIFNQRNSDQDTSSGLYEFVRTHLSTSSR